MASLYMVADEIEDGRLVAPFGFSADGSTYCALSPTPHLDRPGRQAFVSWLAGEMQAIADRLGTAPRA
jgi:DNA-binding transcriptional LysR family regulator